MRETSANEPLERHRNRTRTTSKPEFPACSGISRADTYLLALRCPVYRRRDSHPGFRTELENLAGDGKGKGPSGSTARPKVPKRWPGAHCSVVPRKRRNGRGGKGAGHSRRDLVGQRVTGRTRWSRRKAAAFKGGTSRMNREIHVRICERLGVKIPGATRRVETEWETLLGHRRPGRPGYVYAALPPLRHTSTLPLCLPI